jgi:hypothetical protein
LIRAFAKNLRSFGIPVLSVAPGMQLSPDKIHFCASSERTVGELFRNLFKHAKKTDAFISTAHHPLWHWKYIEHKHYPFCEVCDRKAENGHIDSRNHLLRVHGANDSFHFPRRIEYCSNGTVFKDNTKHPITRDLGAYEPLQANTPVVLGERYVRGCLVTGERYVTRCNVTESNSEESPTSGITKELYVKMTWSDRTTETRCFVYIACGMTRSAHLSGIAPRGLVIKVQNMHSHKTNNNLAEYNLAKEHQELHGLIPEVFGYFEQELGDRRMSFLIVEAAGLTILRVYEQNRMLEISTSAVSLFLRCSASVTRALKTAAVRGITTRDWHVHNVAFTDASDSRVISTFKLVDWAGNTLAPAAMSYKERMENGMQSFLKYLSEPFVYANDPNAKEKFLNSLTAAESAAVTQWDSFAQELKRKMAEWWTQWCGTWKRGDDVPSDEVLDELETSLRSITVPASVDPWTF